MANNKKSMSKLEKLEKLRVLLEGYKKMEQEPLVTDLAKYLGCTRQTLYYDEDYQKILKEFQVGKKNKRKTIASEEYLLDRIDGLNKEIKEKEGKIKKLQSKIADLEAIVKEGEKEIAKERSRTLRIQAYYLHLIELYNKISNKQIYVEPFDLHNLKIDPIDALNNLISKK